MTISFGRFAALVHVGMSPIRFRLLQVHTPTGSLVGERERLVVVESVDDITVGQRLEPDQVLNAGIVGASSNDGVPRRGAANDRNGSAFNVRPPARIGDLRLIQDFKEDTLGVSGGVVRGQCTPQSEKRCDRRFV